MVRSTVRSTKGHCSGRIRSLSAQSAARRRPFSRNFWPKSSVMAVGRRDAVPAAGRLTDAAAVAGHRLSFFMADFSFGDVIDPMGNR